MAARSTCRGVSSCAKALTLGALRAWRRRAPSRPWRTAGTANGSRNRTLSSAALTGACFSQTPSSVCLCRDALVVLERGRSMDPRPLGRSTAHLRVLKALPPASLSRHVWLALAAWARSLGQPCPHSAFLMSPTPRAAAQKTAQTGQARLHPRFRPGVMHVLPHGVEPQPTHTCSG
jgi:hypothetical protein